MTPAEQSPTAEEVRALTLAQARAALQDAHTASGVLQDQLHAAQQRVRELEKERENWVAVPRHATAFMINEARRYLFAGNSETNIEAAYEAMIEAATHA